MTSASGGHGGVLNSAPTRSQFFIGGDWVDPDGPGTIDVLDPATGGLLGTVPEGSTVDAGKAVVAAHSAADDWASWSPDHRARLLRALGAVLSDRAEELARLITAEVGSPLEFSRHQQVGLPIQVVNGIADLLPSMVWEERIDRALVVREPVGVVVAITPWNYPLHQAVAKVAAALGAGCTMMLKPSEVAPFSAFVLADDRSTGSACQQAPSTWSAGLGPVVGEALARHHADRT